MHLGKAAPAVRIRLGSLEPRTITEDFCRRAAALPNLCPQFHLSLQSGCDATLKRMNRKYDTTRYAQSVALLNQYFEHPAVTTDLITGFPEETEEEFSQTLDFLRRCGFAQMHIFPYSIRPGTPAANMRQVPKAVKEERAHRAAEVAAELHRKYLADCVGAVYPVLFEQPRDGKYAGHAPNYMEVLADGADLHNEIWNVKITGTDGESLLGEILEDCVGAVYPVLFEQPRDGRYVGHAPNYMEVLAEGADLHNQIRNVKITGTDGESLLGEVLED